jgi:hypothetical protein
VPSVLQAYHEPVAHQGMTRLAEDVGLTSLWCAILGDHKTVDTVLKGAVSLALDLAR